MTVEIEIACEVLRLLPERAAFWSRRKTLIAADLHWGKEEEFRHGGIPIPFGPIHGDLQRLANAIGQCGAERLLVLGDLWHARAGITADLVADLEKWRASHPELKIDLIRGNHDRRSGPLPASLNINIREEPAVELPFVFQHYPTAAMAGYVLAGHVHPAVILRGPGRQKLRLPCFWFGDKVGLLPAFGGFTGTAEVIPEKGDRVFVVAEDAVVEVRSNP